MPFLALVLQMLLSPLTSSRLSMIDSEDYRRMHPSSLRMRLQAEHELKDDCAVIDGGAVQPYELVSKMQE
ncbi:hypothetical protein SNOG_15046 [Parastagonospora nodorum SN15]|uniref:Uncharacterized protein n=1 Tax=Phaeosphaeria nodorum (strain SN15 / ATCC MYA-4574 / FGSC 10173) TaxID=321614 RepID=Q0TZN2_PHANO|nr:hypothetical protein SNOG_15046 [Parastagonospora nodorum SN15]EAT77589.1 hypothetical protein SNOG_15046 [Parastagonospora nodorum SN15]